MLTMMTGFVLTGSERMNDLINRQAAIEACLRYNGVGWVWSQILDEIEKLPSADVQPVRHGHWYHGEAYPHHLYCSVCYRTALPNDEYVERWGLHMNYCPNCGARMDGEQGG